jgi:selenocysteine lyase/cysteine desulfurase
MTGTSFDPDPWRRDTAAAAAGRIHLNNAGAALMPRPVHDAIVAHLRRESECGGYEAADAAAAEIDAVYDSVAWLVGAQPRNVALVESATTGMALTLDALDLRTGDVILTTNDDYPSNQIMYASLAARRGVRVVRAADAPDGGVDLDSMRECIAAERPALVSVTHVPTHSGLVQPVEAVGALCAEAGVPYAIDACQSVGQIPLDMKRLRCDFLFASARKFLRGPRGIGFLALSDAALDRGTAPTFPDLRAARWTAPDAFELTDDARRFETWEFAFALVLGLGAAAEYARTAGIDAAGSYAAALADRLRARFHDQPGAHVLDRAPTLSAIVTVAFDSMPAEQIAPRLREQAINTSVTRVDYPTVDDVRRAAGSALRISPHYYNTARDIEAAIFALEEFLP